MKTKHLVFIFIVMLLLCLGVVMIVKRRPFRGQLGGDLNKIKDPYLRSWFANTFDVNNSRIESFESLDSMLVAIKGDYKTAFVVNYHHLDPESYVDMIKKKYNSDCVIVVLDGEPDHLEHLVLDDSDIVISTKHNFLPVKGRVFYIPYYIFYMALWKNIPFDKLVKPVGWKPPMKTEFCVFAYSNCRKKYKGVGDREEFFGIMQRLSGGRVDNLGKCLGGKSKGAVLGNDALFAPYRFAIVFENDQIPGYVSEKIVNAMLSGCIPIYFGAPDIGEHFNKKSFIDASDFASLEECAEYVLKVDSDSGLMNSILAEPWLNGNKWSGDVFLEKLDAQLRGLMLPMFLPMERKPDKKIVMQTFAEKKGDGDRIMKEAKESSYFDEMYVGSLDELDGEFMARNKAFIDSNKHHGYFIWRPQVIYERLEKMDEGSVLVWVDSDCTIQSGSPHVVSGYVSMATPLMAFRMRFRTGDWTKMDTALHFKVEDMSEFMDGEQDTASYIVFTKCDETMKFVKKWRDSCEVYHLIDDTPSIAPNSSGFEENRYDQAVFNILCKMGGIPESLDNYSDDKDDLFLADGVRRPFVPSRIGYKS